MTALSKQSPLLPIDWAMPAARAFWPKAAVQAEGIELRSFAGPSGFPPF